MCKGGQNTVTQQSAPPPQIMQAYENLINRGTQVANQPLQQYGGAMVAGFNPQQTTAFNNTNTAAGAAQPYLDVASNYAAQGAAPVYPDVMQFSPSAVGQYESPYQNDVINSTLATINQQNAVQSNQLLGQGIAAGNAFGGDRMGVAQAQLGLNQALATNQTIAGLENQNYAQALGEFNNQQATQLNAMETDAQRAANAAYQYGGLGSEAQQTGLAGASAQMQVGGLEQQLQQEQLNVPYEQYLQNQAYPFQTTQFLGGLVGSLGSEAGGTSSTTSPSPSALSQVAGLGMTGLSIAGMLGWAPFANRGGRVGYDDGGAVQIQPGPDPSVISQGNPQIAALYSRLQAASPQQLTRVAGAGGMIGQLAQRALMAKRQSLPGPTVQTPQVQMAGLGGLPGVSADSGSLADQGYARGGRRGFADGGYTDDPMLDASLAPLTDPHVQDAYGVPQGPYPSNPRPPAPISPVTGTQTTSVVPQTQQAPRGGRGLPAPPPPAQEADSGQSGLAGDTATAGSLLGASSDSQDDSGGSAGGSGKQGLGIAASPWYPLMAAGLGMMSGTSPFAGVNIGRGGMEGLKVAAEQPGFLANTRRSIAEASSAETQADLSKLSLDAYKMGLAAAQKAGVPGAGGSSGGSSGGDSGTGSASGQGASSGTGSDAGGSPSGAVTLDWGTLAPGYAGNMRLAKTFAMSPVPWLRDSAKTYSQAAEQDPQYLRVKGMLDKIPGATFNQNGTVTVPKDVLGALSQEAQTKPQVISPGGTEIQNGNVVASSAQPVNTVDTDPSSPNYGRTIRKQIPTEVTTYGGPAASGTDASGTATTQPTATNPGSVGGESIPPLFHLAEQHYGLPSRLLSAQGWVESHFDPAAISPKGAQGVMQDMPGTAKQYGFDPTKPDQAIDGSARIMRDLLGKYKDKGGIVTALAAYDWGQGNADAWLKAGGDVNKLPIETQRYILGVMQHMQPGEEPPGIGRDGQAVTQTAQTQAAQGQTTGQDTGAPVVTGLSPEETKTFGNQADEYQASKKSYANAQDVKGRLVMMDHAIDTMNQAGWSSTGFGAQARLGLAKAFNGVEVAAGLQPSFDAAKIGSWEDLNKEAIRTGFELVNKSFGGSREAQMIVQTAMSAVPNAENTYLGAKLVSSSLQQAAQRQIDYYKFEYGWAQHHAGNTGGADIAFNEAHPPQQYAMTAIVNAVPQQAIAVLKQRPNTAAVFDSHFGPGVAEYILKQGQQ